MNNDWQIQELENQVQRLRRVLQHFVKEGEVLVYVNPNATFTRKISLIKGVRATLGEDCGLKAAKDFVEGTGELIVTQQQAWILGVMFELDGQRNAFVEVRTN